MDSNNFMRIFDDRNEHKLSIVACGNGYDLCCPNGKVVYCGVDPELVEVLEDYLIVKEFNLKEFNLIVKEFNLIRLWS